VRFVSSISCWFLGNNTFMARLWRWQTGLRVSSKSSGKTEK
jgi:hypothetical protein